MARRCSIRLPVEDADSIIKHLQELLKSPNLDGQSRRSLGLALKGVAQARHRSPKRKVVLREADILRVLRCFAEAGGWKADWETVIENKH